MDICEGIYLINSQNYTDREMNIIYGNIKEIPENEFFDLLDKCTDKYDDWRVFYHLTKKYHLDNQLAIMS